MCMGVQWLSGINVAFKISKQHPNRQFFSSKLVVKQFVQTQNAASLELEKLSRGF